MVHCLFGTHKALGSIYNTAKNKIKNKRQNTMVLGGVLRRGEKLLCNEFRISVWDNEKVVELDSADGCTI